MLNWDVFLLFLFLMSCAFNKVWNSPAVHLLCEEKAVSKLLRWATSQHCFTPCCPVRVSDLMLSWARATGSECLSRHPNANGEHSDPPSTASSDSVSRGESSSRVAQHSSQMNLFSVSDCIVNQREKEGLRAPRKQRIPTESCRGGERNADWIQRQ